MDIAKSISFLTEDERWLEKLGIGVAVTIISGVGSIVLVGFLGMFIMIGYSLRLLQNVRDGAEKPLPEWNQWAEDLKRGLKWFVVAAIWGLPLIFMIIPMIVGGSMVDQGSNVGDTIGGLILAVGGCLTFLYGLFVALMSPGFTIAFARDESIRSGLQMTSVWQWTMRNLGQVIIVILAVMVASFVLPLLGALAGAILCLIGLVVTIPLASFVTSLVQHHLYGQLARSFPMEY